MSSLFLRFVCEIIVNESNALTSYAAEKLSIVLWRLFAAISIRTSYLNIIWYLENMNRCDPKSFCRIRLAWNWSFASQTEICLILKP